MQVIRNAHEMKSCAIALGNFDGLHIAHVTILKECISYAKKRGIESGVLLFDSHTETITKKEDIKLLTPLNEKLEIIKDIGLDFVFIQKFDEEFMKLSPQQFFDYMIKDLKAKALFAGYDYSFGYKACGTSDTLKKFGKENDIYINIIESVNIDSNPVSSSLIRELILSGKITDVRKYLGRDYEISGKVVSGKQNGRKMGLPTANVEYDKNKLLPNDGVYSGNVMIDGYRYKALINIGKNPTFDAQERTVEAHIIDFSEDLYDKHITVEFTKKIRGEKKFTSPDELRLQIQKDLKNIL